MTQTMEAIYDGKVLRPETTLSLEPNTRVRITIEPVQKNKDAQTSFLRTARSLELSGPADWSTNVHSYLFGDEDERR